MVGLAEIGAGLEVLGGIKGLLGGGGPSSGKAAKAVRRQTEQAVLGQVHGARQAEEQFGVNVLTALGVSSPGGFNAGGGAAPLASIDLITGGLRGIDDVVSGDADRRRQADILNLDMAKLKLEQARSGVVVTPNYAVNSVGSGPSPLGVRPAQVYAAHGTGSGGGNASLSDRSVSGPPVLGNVARPDPYLDRGTGLFINGEYWESPPGWSNGEAIETEFGEGPVSWPAQALYGGAWLGHNFGLTSKVGPARDDTPYIDAAKKKSDIKKPLKAPPYSMRFDPNHRDGYYRAF